MSNQPFTFPPPPPPPPKRTTEAAQAQDYGSHNVRGSFRGGHSWRGDARGGRGGGRGGRGGFAHPRGGHNPPPTNYRPNLQNTTFNNTPQRGGGGFLNPPHKRNHAAAFNPPSQSRPRPSAAPAVPSFNATIEHLLPRKPSIDLASPSGQKPKKQNILGLTPAKLEHDSDPEDDEDEEARLVVQPSAAGREGLMFEYRGHTSTLKTAAEIAAWISERRKRYPTAAKVEAAKKEAEEKKRKWEEEREAKREAHQQAQRERADQRKAEQEKRKAEQQRQKASSRAEPTAALDATSRAMLKAEKLRQKALKAQQDLAKAEEALRRAQEKDQTATTNAAGQPRGEEEAPETESAAMNDVDEAVDSDDADMTSSSGSSSDSDSEANDDIASDSDSAPETLSTKHAAQRLDAIPAPNPESSTAGKAGRPRNVCKNYAKYKRCKFGSSCRFSHDLSLLKRSGGDADENEDGDHNDDGNTRRKPGGAGERRGQKRDQGPSTSTSTGKGRKGLYQLLVEKEQEEERKRILSAIITLGEKGVLEERESASVSVSAETRAETT